MNIFLIGGTGLVGSCLLPLLLERSYKVFVLSRSKNKLEAIKASRAFPIIGDITEMDPFRSQLPERLDLIILLAMPNIDPRKRINKGRKEELTRETNSFFKNSMDLAVQYGVPVFLPGGTSFSIPNDEVADEKSPMHRKGLTEIGKDTDRLVHEAIRTNTPRIVQFLYGKIYGNGGLFLFMYGMMEKGLGKIMGKGDNCIPNVHAFDAASAIMGKAEPGPMPEFIIRLIFGKEFFEVVRMGCKVSNQKAKDMLGWKLTYPSYKEGLEATIREIRATRV